PYTPLFRSRRPRRPLACPRRRRSPACAWPGWWRPGRAGTARWRLSRARPPRRGAVRRLWSLVLRGWLGRVALRAWRPTTRGWGVVGLRALSGNQARGSVQAGGIIQGPTGLRLGATRFLGAG